MVIGSTDEKKLKFYSVLEVLTIVLLAFIPLFMTFPYRVNIFLSWEGAYRISQGQIPFKDFGIPMGYMYWIIPAIFFKIFGPAMVTLVKAQVIINIISGLAFRSVLKSLSVDSGVRLLCVLLYCISFSFFNFWPWYNHTVIVYEMIGLAFLMKYFFSINNNWIFLSLSALFIFFSFFTKQDGGALAFLVCLSLLLYECIRQKKWTPLIVFLSSIFIVAMVIIVPLLRYNFTYWFNYGQPPHSSRISLFDITDEFLYSSQWIKFYLLLIVLLLMIKYKSVHALLRDRKNFLFTLLTIGILIEAAIFQVTSYTPPDNNIFFHSFAFAFILSFFSENFKTIFYKPKVILSIGFLLIIWWSGVFWKYSQSTVQNMLVSKNRQKPKENIVNRHTYILYPPTGDIPVDTWDFSKLESFNKIKMPKPTIDGIQRLLNMPLVKNTTNLRVLNMSELTPLLAEMKYQTEHGTDIPLWYHLGVGMFNKEARDYEQKIVDQRFDLVLFEYIPMLNNFYPFRIRDTLLSNYQVIDSFPAPRRGNTPGTIEIFVKKNP